MCVIVFVSTSILVLIQRCSMCFRSMEFNELLKTLTCSMVRDNGQQWPSMADENSLLNFRQSESKVHQDAVYFQSLSISLSPAC